jgi:hypothetical protein
VKVTPTHLKDMFMLNRSFLVKILIAVFTLMAATRAGANDGERIEVPVYSHNKAAFLDMNVGSSGPLSMFIDSGAGGIRIHPGNLKEQDIKHTGIPDRVAYADGSSGLIGEVVRGKVTLGDFTLPGQTPIQLITKHFCKEGEGEEYCGEAKAKHGGAGTIGLQMPDRASFKKAHKEKEVLNPLLTQGSFSYILSIPRDDNEKGVLIINPTRKEKSRFVKIRLDPEGGAAIPVCINQYCFKARIDTGASAGGRIPIVSKKDIRLLGLPINDNKIAPDTTFDIVLGEGKNSLSVKVTSSEKGESGYHVKEGKKLAQGNIGIGIFRYIDVLYDFKTGVIGVAMKE